MDINDLRDELAKLQASGELLPTKEAAAILGITEPGLRARTLRGEPDAQPAIPANGSLFSREQVDRMKAVGRRAPGPVAKPKADPEGTRKK